MLFGKFLLLLSATVSSFALAQTATVSGVSYTSTVKVMNAHTTPTLTSSTPVHKWVVSTGGFITTTGGRWNSTSIKPSLRTSSVDLAPTSQVVAVESAVAAASSSTHTGGATSGCEVAGAMMAGVVAVAGLVMM